MPRLTFSLIILCVSTNLFAHGPQCKQCQIEQPYDLIGPVGTNMRQSYRRTCNRPTYLAGKLAHIVAPTSQEAIAWHKAEHKGIYDKNVGRVEPRYFYPKPWEALKIGPRASLASQKTVREIVPQNVAPLPSEGTNTIQDEMSFGDETVESLRPDLRPTSPNGIQLRELGTPKAHSIDEVIPPAPSNSLELRDAIQGAIEETSAVGSGLLE